MGGLATLRALQHNRFKQGLSIGLESLARSPIQPAQDQKSHQEE
jgi:hypothetical protein